MLLIVGVLLWLAVKLICRISVAVNRFFSNHITLTGLVSHRTSAVGSGSSVHTVPIWNQSLVSGAVNHALVAIWHHRSEGGSKTAVAHATTTADFHMRAEICRIVGRGRVLLNHVYLLLGGYSWKVKLLFALDSVGIRNTWGSCFLENGALIYVNLVLFLPIIFWNAKWLRKLLKGHLCRCSLFIHEGRRHDALVVLEARANFWLLVAWSAPVDSFGTSKRVWVIMVAELGTLSRVAVKSTVRQHSLKWHYLSHLKLFKIHRVLTS